MKKFDPSIERQMFWSHDVGGTSRCPSCRSNLENEPHIFMMAVRDAGDIHPFIAGTDAGYFCSRCPTVVLDNEKFSEFAQLSLGGDTNAEFAVVGLVDLEAVPEEKRTMPFGGDDNPIPLVKFANVPQRNKNRRSRAGRRKKKKRQKKKDRR